MKFILVTFDGGILPVAYQLKREGASIWVCQIESGKELTVKSWITDKEEPERTERRLSLYDGLLMKYGLEETYEYMKAIKNKDEVFVIIDHNSLYEVGEKLLAMGFTKGLFPIEEDFNREKDRQEAKEFVNKNYPGIKVDEVKEISGVDNVIKFIQESDKAWCVKSDGNFGETIVPDKDDPKLAKQEVIAELERQRKDLEKGKMLLEEKIPDAIEICPAMVFWNGKPVYSQADFETRMFGSGDIGPQTGGNQSVIMNTALDCELNKIAFPQVIQDIAKQRKGMFIADAGLLYDGKWHFTEFAGNRWGWGGIFSELAGARDKKKYVTQYFEDVSNGVNPYRYKFGVSLALYNMKVDKKDGELSRGDLPIIIGDEDSFFMVQIKREDGQLVNVGYRTYDDGPLGYVTCYGNEIEKAVEYLYKKLETFSFKGVYYRPQEDFLSRSYVSSILNRYDKTKKFLSGEASSKIGYDFDGTVSEGIVPKKGSVIITGRTKDMVPEAKQMMKDMGMPNTPIIPYPNKSELFVSKDKRKKLIAEHKVENINKLGITKFVENEPIQIQIIRKKTDAKVINANSML